MAESVFSQLSADLLRHGYGIRFRATGESMHPTIRTGETITVQPVAPSTLRYADIVLYRTERSVLAHRVVGRPKAAGQRRTFLLRGDACLECDEPVAESQVLGKVVTVERGNRIIGLDRGIAKTWHLVRVYLCLLKRRLDEIGL